MVSIKSMNSNHIRRNLVEWHVMNTPSKSKFMTYAPSEVFVSVGVEARSAACIIQIDCILLISFFKPCNE